MKKLILMLAIIVFVVLGLNNDLYLFAKKIFLDEPTTHRIQHGEYLSKIAKQYYGNADYWRELALINRAPDSDLVFPGENIVLPSEEVIRKIRNTRWLSKVNDYVDNQQEIIARAEEGEKRERFAESQSVAPTEKQSVKKEQASAVDKEQFAGTNGGSSEEDKAGFPYLLIGFFLLVVLAAIAVTYAYRKKKREEEPEWTDEEESEPDYNEYLNKKKESRTGRQTRKDRDKEEEYAYN